MRLRPFVTLLFLAAGASAAPAAEGMFPMSELDRLDLSAAGLELAAADIFNPDAPALVDGICKLGGCTGSFVSDQGLILTNHHCAFRAVRDASDATHDYLAAGFSAATQDDEVPAVGYTVRITESYHDVSAEVLAAVADVAEPAARTRAVERVTKEISLRWEQEHPGRRAEVAEMFPGRSYVLFVYTYLRDVRLVYAPPLAVGNFGGEFDNWIWPRHTGDFSFMRAYVGPDGEPADHAPENVPYRPRRVLPVGAEGVSAGDPVFVVGYPGRTYRHRSSHHLAFLAEVYMPAIVEWYGWQIGLLEELGRGDRERQLRLAPRLKSLHNTHKNYRGKLQGIARLDLVAARRAEESRLLEFVDGDESLAGRTDVLERIAGVFADQTVRTPWELWLRAVHGSPAVVRAAMTIWENAVEREKPDLEREPAYMDRNRRQTRDRLRVAADAFDPEADRLVLAELLRRAGDIPPARSLPVLAGLTGAEGTDAATAYLEEIYAATTLRDPAAVLAAYDLTREELAGRGDPLLDLAAALYAPWRELREEQKRRKGELDVLRAELLDLRRAFLGGEFVPDANGTLRLSWGRVAGYEPRDAVHYAPVTTVRGLLEKHTGEPPYDLPAGVRELAAAGVWGNFAPDAAAGVPVNLLYSTDTTGGNSGSPLCDARGRVVGLNFDRAWEATINDFAWDQAYSRSIGVDIRYVLWVTWQFGGGARLLREMGIDPGDG